MAEAHDSTPAAVVEPRPASTVVLMRERSVESQGATETVPGSAVLEVLLTKRPASMAFAPDMHVFPGGRVDVADTHPRLAARSVRSALDAAEALGGDLAPVDALAHFVAAIREVFEETGVLLADPLPRARELEVARAEVLHVPGGFAPMAEAFDLRLRTDLLIPLSRWVTPPGLARRFDTRFFVAELPRAAEVEAFDDEVDGFEWLTPREALDSMATGDLGMWLPTSATLQQLEHVRSIEDVRTRLAPGRLVGIDVVEVLPGIVRIVMPAGGGVAGQPVCAYLAGTGGAGDTGGGGRGGSGRGGGTGADAGAGAGAAWLIDPGDPTGRSIEAAFAIAEARGTQIVGIALTCADPDHAAGVEAIRDGLDVPVVVGHGGGHDLPFAAAEVGDGAILDAGALRLRAVATPGPRPDHLAFVLEEVNGAQTAVFSGDLEGRRGARSLPGPADDAAWTGSVARLHSVAPGVPWFGAHPASAADAEVQSPRT